MRLIGEGSSYSKMLKEAEKSADQLEKETRELAKAEKEANDLLRQGAAVTASVEKVSERYAREVESLNKLHAAGAITQETYRRKMEQLSKQAGISKTKLGELANTITSLGQGMARFGAKISLAVTAPLMAIAHKAYGAAGDLNEILANVSSLGVGTDRINDLKNGVQELSKVMGRDTQDVAQGLYDVVSTFEDTGDTLEHLRINSMAASAGLATTSDAIRLTSAVTKGYGDTSAAAVMKASDLAFIAVNLGMTTFPELAASIGRVTPVTNEMRISQEELFAVMATMTGVTGTAAEVSTQMRASIQALMNPTREMSVLLKDLGFASGKAMVQQLGYYGAIEKVVEASKRTGIPLGKYMGSIEGQLISLSLVNTQGEIYADRLKRMGDAAGTTQKAFDAQTKGINSGGFAMKQFMAEMKTTLQDLGDAIAPMMDKVFVGFGRKVTQILNKVVQAFTKMSPGMQKVITIIMAIVVSIGPAIVAVGGLVAGVGALLGTLLAFQAALPILAAIAASVASMAVPFIAVAGAIALAWTAMGTLAAYIIWPDKVRAAWDSLSSFLVKFFWTMVSNAKVAFDTFTKIIGIVLGWLGARFLQFFTTDFARYAAQGVLKVLDIFSGLSMNLIQVMTKGPSAIGPALLRTLGSALGGVSEGFSSESLAKSINEALKEGLNELDFPGFNFNEAEVRKAAEPTSKAIGGAIANGIKDGAEEGLKGFATLTVINQRKARTILDQILGEAKTFEDGKGAMKLYRLEVLGITKEMEEWKIASEALNLIEQKKTQKELADGVDALTESLKKQQATMGMTSEEAKIWELDQKGLDSSTRSYLTALSHVNKRLEDKEKLMKKGESVTEQYATAEEKFTKKYEDLLQLFDIGAIKQGTFDRALKEAEKELQDANLKKEVEFKIQGLDAVRAGTAEFKKLQEDTVKFTKLNEASAAAGGLVAEANKKFKQQKLLRESEDAQARSEILSHTAPESLLSSITGGTSFTPSPVGIASSSLDSRLEQSQSKMEDLLSRIADATEETAEKEGIDIESVGLGSL